MADKPERIVGTSTRKLRVVHSVWGSFHLNLTRELHQRGMLEAFFTSFPKSRFKDEAIPLDKIHSDPWLHTLVAGKARYGLAWDMVDRPLLRWNVRRHDRFLQRHLPPCDAFVGLSGSGLEAGRLAQARGGKYVCDRGSSHIVYQENLLKEEYQRWGHVYRGTDPFHVDREQREYAEADCVVAPSKFARQSYLEMGLPAEKVMAIPQCVSLGRFEKVADPDPKEFTVLFVGQLSLRKGIPYLLQAFDRFRHPHKRLLLLGSAPPEVKCIFRDRPVAGVEFLPRQSREELIALMSRSHVMVLPSIEDGFGMVLAEAMACGCPCISSQHTGGPDLYEHGKEGFLVPIRDPEAITQALDQLAQDPALRQRMSEAALERVKRLGGSHTYGESWCQLLQKLTSGRDA